MELFQQFVADPYVETSTFVTTSLSTIGYPLGNFFHLYEHLEQKKKKKQQLWNLLLYFMTTNKYQN